jgi:hypothetical protein
LCVFPHAVSVREHLNNISFRSLFSR